MSRSVNDLTAAEQDNVRAALRFLRVRCGTRKLLARALRYELSTISHVLYDGVPVSASMAFRAARLAGVTVDDLLAGKYPPAGVCRNCGHLPDPGGHLFGKVAQVRRM